MKQGINQFRVRQSPPGVRMIVWFILPFLLVIVGPLCFGAMLLWGGVGVGLAFFLLMFLLNWLIDNKVKADTVVTTDSNGIAIQVIKKGMGIPLGSSFSSWEQLRGFQYSTIGRGPATLTLLWVNGHKIAFQEQETKGFYNYLVQAFPDKEKAFWWPPSP